MILQVVFKSSGQAIEGGIVSLTNITCMQELVLPQKSAIVYVLVMISGQEFPSVSSSNNWNVVSSIPQLSNADPPALTNAL